MPGRKPLVTSRSWSLTEAPSTLTDAQQLLIERLCSDFAGFTRTQNESLYLHGDSVVGDDNTLHGSYPRIVQLWPA